MPLLPVTASVGYALKKTQYILRLTMDDGLRKIELTTPQYAVMSALSEAPGLSGAELARRCFVTPQTMTGIVGNLAAAGLIARATDPTHGRIIKTQLTPKGLALLGQAHTIVTRIEERMTGELDRAEREALADLLMQCAEALAPANPSSKN